MTIDEKFFFWLGKNIADILEAHLNATDFFQNLIYYEIIM